MKKITASSNYESNSLKKTAMFFLALLPLLHWYDIGAPIGLGETFMLMFTVMAFAKGYFRIKVFPKIFYALWAYIAFNWYYNNGINAGLSLLPGGPTFFVFAMIVMGSILLFDFDYLYKIMKWIVLISILIFVFQFILLHTSGTHYCFVPNLTDRFTYEDMTYAELAARQYKYKNPCAIFMEKSYMAYYLVIFLCLELFYGKGKDVLFSKLSLLIIFTLLILKSGSGLIGMVMPVVIKVISYYWDKKNLRYVMIILFFLLLTGGIYIYLRTDIGAAMFARQSEITEEGTSGFSRVVYGYTFFENLSPIQKVIGTSISNMNDLTYLSYAGKNFSVNGIQAPLIQLGIIGLGVWLLFYIIVILKTNHLSKLCVLTLFVLSSIEVTYLGPYMVLLTVIPLVNYQKI